MPDRAGGAIFRGRFLPYALVVPQLVIVAIFFLWPTVRAIYESFEETNAFGTGARFSGLTNFVNAFSVAGEVGTIEVTVILACVTTVLAMAIGLFLAVEADQVGRVRRVYRTLFIWTYAVPSAIAGALWLFLFEPGLGAGARVLVDLGVNWNFALHSLQAFALLVAVIVWQQAAYNFLFYTAGLQMIPRDVFEAASIDGAGKLARFWQVVFPLLSPTTFYLLVMNVLYAFFSSFAIIDVITQGGPGNATTTVVYQVYRDGFQNGNTGLAGAETVFLLLIAAALTAVQFRFLNRKVFYR
ncbi:MAG: ABC transporter permease subunit [Actinomycetota bacterium]|jgi:sn-glycerol 3-phosphate transport system permease protein|nr:ABC transporter permease subunit [Actinomycetota bacterium]